MIKVELNHESCFFKTQPNTRRGSTERTCRVPGCPQGADTSPGFPADGRLDGWKAQLPLPSAWQQQGAQLEGQSFWKSLEGEESDRQKQIEHRAQEAQGPANLFSLALQGLLQYLHWLQRF